MAPFLNRPFRAVLFDLDGTLVDTAPDMVAVLQDMQRDRGVEPVAYEDGRRRVSNGAIGLLRLGFPSVAAEIDSPLHREYLSRYENRICERSTVFDGLEILLDRLEQGGRPWGVVTNKPARLTSLLLEGLKLAHRSACTVSGDTLPERKPDPAPMIHACEIAGIDPDETIYVGDAARDIEAGIAAGMVTIAVEYGYINVGDDLRNWGADVIATDTADLSQILLKAVNLSP